MNELFSLFAMPISINPQTGQRIVVRNGIAFEKVPTTDGKFDTVKMNAAVVKQFKNVNNKYK